MGVFRGSLDASLRDANGGKVREEESPSAVASENAQERGSRFIFSGHKSKSYVEEMDHSRYCIIPRGNTPWTRRFFDAAVRGCIPAVLSDPVAFPFEHLLDFRTMTVKLPEQWALRLASELHAINSSAASRLQQALQLYWPAFSLCSGWLCVRYADARTCRAKAQYFELVGSGYSQHGARLLVPTSRSFPPGRLEESRAVVGCCAIPH